MTKLKIFFPVLLLSILAQNQASVQAKKLLPENTKNSLPQNYSFDNLKLSFLGLLSVIGQTAMYTTAKSIDLDSETYDSIDPISDVLIAERRHFKRFPIEEFKKYLEITESLPECFKSKHKEIGQVITDNDLTPELILAIFLQQDLVNNSIDKLYTSKPLWPEKDLTPDQVEHVGKFCAFYIKQLVLETDLDTNLDTKIITKQNHVQIVQGLRSLTKIATNLNPIFESLKVEKEKKKMELKDLQETISIHAKYVLKKVKDLSETFDQHGRMLTDLKTQTPLTLEGYLKLQPSIRLRLEGLGDDKLTLTNTIETISRKNQMILGAKALCDNIKESINNELNFLQKIRIRYNT